MRLKHFEPEINEKAPFRNCCTGRREAGETLTRIIDNIEMGCTISLTGEWGSGKTTFLRMWRQDLINHCFPTVLLNAWKTEWAEDPLIAVLSCMLDVINKSDDSSKQAIEDVKKIVSSFIKKPLPVLGEVVNTVVEATTGVHLKGVSDSLKKMSSEAFDEAVEDFNSREESLEKLKIAIEAFAWDVNQGSDDPKPLVFIIDELDRCRPDYSVRLLEVLKHFFEVKNIVFICAIDKKHMEDAIKGYYGSESINASEYLRRFFDLEVELPTPNYDVFCRDLYEYYNLGAFFDSPSRKSAYFFNRDGEVFISSLVSLASKGNLNLRQVERICAYTKLSLEGKPERIYYYPTLSLILTYLRFFDNSFYQDLKCHKLSAQEILTRFETKYAVLIDSKDDSNQRNNRYEMAFYIGKLISSYIRDNHNNEVFFDDQKKETPLKSRVFSEEEINNMFGRVASGQDFYQLNWLFSVLEILKIEDGRNY